MIDVQRSENGLPDFINVAHECIDGWHKFTSPQIPGLYLTAQQDDLEELYSEIPIVISALIKADFDIEVKVAAQTPYSAYLKELPNHYTPGWKPYTIEELAA